jgi:hypothetical protein
MTGLLGDSALWEQVIMKLKGYVKQNKITIFMLCIHIHTVKREFNRNQPLSENLRSRECRLESEVKLPPINGNTHQKTRI